MPEDLLKMKVRFGELVHEKGYTTALVKRTDFDTVEETIPLRRVEIYRNRLTLARSNE